MRFARLLPLLVLAACQTATDPLEPRADTTAAPAHAGHVGHGVGESSYTDVRFLDRMIAHHEMAVEMAQLADSHAVDPRVRGVAAEVLATQRAEIDTMRAWRTRWFADAPPAPPLTVDEHAAMGMAAPMDSLAALTGEAFDERFLRDMIPHHAGAITMAAEAAARTERPEIRRFAEGIVATQARETGQMQGWRR